MPPIDVNAIINAYKELSMLKWKKGPEDKRRKQATMRFRFAANISTAPENLHIDYYWQQFLQDFANIKKLSKKRKQRLLELTKVQLKDVNEGKRDLLSVIEDDDNKQNEQYHRIITLPDGWIACAWQEILSTKSTSKVYNGGLRRMRQVLMENTPDIFSAKPLEMIYAWTLSIKSRNCRQLEFRNWWFNIECKRVEYGRIFPTDNETDVFPNLTTILDENTIYLADERKEKKMPMHPRADLFFRTQDNKLVVIDVAGTKQEKKIKTKVKRLHDIEQLVKSQGMDCYGVVLAPNAEEIKYSRGQNVVVGGEEARNLMGGLVQFVSWLQ